jgi:GNAT superfamily N-acetyltransferase
MGSFLVRPATDADASMAIDCLRRSITELCSADHQDDAPTLERWLRNKTPERFCAWRCEPDNFLIVAVSQTMVCGVGAVRQNGDLGLCYVHPSWQRQGVGRALLHALEEQARQWCTDMLRLVSTTTARSFYERYGYVYLPDESGPGYGVLYDYVYAKILRGVA